MGQDYPAQLEAEVETWCMDDPNVRAEKIRRERMRHPKLIRDLLLDRLGTHAMDVLEVGGGPYPVSDLLPTNRRVVVDPNSDEYRRYYPCPDHVAGKAEDMRYDRSFDLAICTNALDHVEDPDEVVRRMSIALAPGGYMALMCAENNALTHPHPAHALNITSDWCHRILDFDYETVWELTFARDGYRYGWVPYEGRRGQPAFALLMRKCVGYAL